jgi:hypothetical protein
MGSSFARYFEENLGVALEKHPRFELFAREDLEEILTTVELSLNDLFDPETVVDTGRLRGIQGLLRGRYFDEGAAVRVFLTLTDVESGLVAAKTEVLLPKIELPASVSVLPENYSDALYVIDELSQIQQADTADFRVRLWTVRGDGATYRDGEELVIHLFSNRDCYILFASFWASPTAPSSLSWWPLPSNFRKSRRTFGGSVTRPKMSLPEV